MEAWKALMSEWIKIESVDTEETKREDAPLGRGVKDAIHWIAKTARKDGFAVCEVPGIYATIDYGVGDHYIGVFCHCDVVPAGDGWKTNPFQLTYRDGNFYGRGVVDNKGPAVCVYLAMKAIKDKGIDPSRKIRLFIGGNEESGFRSIRTYLQENPQPDFGFVPDAKFPVLHGERGGGIVQFRGGIESLIKAKAGEVSNVIPDCLAVNGDALSKRCKQALGMKGISVREQEDGYQLQGEGGHASKPQNASLLIQDWLTILEEEWSEELLQILDFSKTWAKGLPMKGQCGNLQITPTILKIDGQELHLTCDIRYPETMTMNELKQSFSDFKIKTGCRYVGAFQDRKKSRYVAPDHFLVQELLALYRECGGNSAEEPRLTSAGTYMSELENTVIFGMESSDGESGNIHKANEFISEKQVEFGKMIYEKALQKMISW